MEKRDFILSIKLTFIFLFGATLFWFLFSCQLLWAYDPGGAPLDLKKYSRMNDTILIQPGTGTSGGSGTARFRTYYGTQACVGVGSNGYILSGTLTGLPFIDYLYGNGSSTINFSGFTHVAVGGSDIPSSSSVSSKIDAVNGTGTTNTFTNTTLAGQGTITATFRINGVDISPTELGYIDGASSNLQTQITTTTGSITNHAHTGSDGTTKINHDSIIGTGTNSHPTIDTFIASKASASGLASLDGSSLVVQNPANGTSTPSASKIPIALGTGKLDDSWMSNNITKLGTPTTDNISEGNTNKYYTDGRVNAAVGSLSVNALADVIISSPANGQFVTYNGSNWINGTSSASVGFGAITGTPTDNAFFSTTPATNKIPYTGTSTNLNSWIDNTIIEIPATTTAITGTSANGRWYYMNNSLPAGNDSYTKLLLHMNNVGTSTFTDSSSSQHGLTAYGNTIGTSSTMKFGAGSGYFDGSGDYLTMPNSADWEFGSGDFTIDLQVYFESNTGVPKALIGRNDSVDRGWMVYWDINNTLHFTAKWNTGYLDSSFAWTPTLSTWYHVAVVRSGNNLAAYINGSQIGSTLDVTGKSINTSATVLYVGVNLDNGAYFTGKMDEIRVSKGIARWTANFTSPTNEYDSAYAYASMNYIPSGTTTPLLQLQDAGTTTNQTYLLANVSTIIAGAGTTSAVTATTTVYSLWSVGAIRATAFNVASTEKIKENIKPIVIKPDMLDAEALSKHDYIWSHRSAWKSANQDKYTTITNTSGTGTVYKIDNEKMESDYLNYIELEWASDLNQPVYTENIQKTYEKGFWKKFDAITPKSWNPKGVSNIVHKGFVVEDVPPEVKGDDGQSIDPMALIAYMTKAQQVLKSDTIFALKTLKELITTGTVTQQKIDYVNERLEVLNP